MNRSLVFFIGVLPLVVACDHSSCIEDAWLLAGATAEGDPTMAISEYLRRGRAETEDSHDDPDPDRSRQFVSPAVGQRED